MLKSVSNRNIVLACSADCPADNHARQLTLFLYGTLPTISEMSQIIKHLSKFDDYELAFFAKFKLQTYMQETQKEINSYLVERNISESRIEELISSNPKSKLTDKKDRCWRCYSDKLRVHKVEWTDTANRLDYSDEIAAINGATGKPTYKNEVICDVCGQWNKDPNSERKKSFKEKTAEYFKAVVDGILHGL